MKDIQVDFKIDEEMATCPICFSFITTPIIQCSNAAHFVCLSCLKQCRRKGSCPLCQTAKVFHNKFLEKTIKNQMKECSHEGCQKLIFPWDDYHEQQCYYKPIPCPFCVDKISKASIKEHLKECVPWIDVSNPKEGSYCVTDASELLKRGLNIELESIKKSFVVLRNNQIIVFKRNEMEYELSFINLSTEFVSLDLTYWLVQDSRAFDKYSTISLRKDSSEEEFKATKQRACRLNICFWLNSIHQL